MESNFSFCFSFSGIVIRMTLPKAARLPDALTAFLCEDPGIVDAEYEICLIQTPLNPCSQATYHERGADIYHTEEGWLRIYCPLIEADGCQVACLLCPDGKNKLYYPEAKWDYYAEQLNFLHLIAIETPLLQRNAFLLHSSVVLWNGKTILFSGPSGAGKSTQAQLWQTHLHAKILNGDRCVVMKKEDGFYGGGSPWSGTSGIYDPDQAPIAAIFLVHQADENRVTALGRGAFAPLFTQTVVNSWDPNFMAQITDLFSELIGQVPIYRLDCRPDEDAVMTALNAIL